jgi:hypothetical protein
MAIPGKIGNHAHLNQNAAVALTHTAFSRLGGRARAKSKLSLAMRKTTARRRRNLEVNADFAVADFLTRDPQARFLILAVCLTGGRGCEQPARQQPFVNTTEFDRRG